MACSSLLSDEDLSRFRTKPCRRVKTTEGCDFGSRRCQYSHNDYWPRRCPFYLSDSACLRYVPLVCPEVQLSVSEGILSNLCKRGGACPFAHSHEEVIYHPLFYKMHLCEDYHHGRGCDTYYCPFVHGYAEKRPARHYKLPYAKGAQIPRIEGVTLVDRTGESGSTPSNTAPPSATQHNLPPVPIPPYILATSQSFRKDVRANRDPHMGGDTGGTAPSYGDLFLRGPLSSGGGPGGMIKPGDSQRARNSRFAPSDAFRTFAGGQSPSNVSRGFFRHDSRGMDRTDEPYLRDHAFRQYPGSSSLGQLYDYPLYGGGDERREGTPGLFSWGMPPSSYQEENPRATEQALLGPLLDSPTHQSIVLGSNQPLFAGYSPVLSNQRGHLGDDSRGEARPDTGSFPQLTSGSGKAPQTAKGTSAHANSGRASSSSRGPQISGEVLEDFEVDPCTRHAERMLPIARGDTVLVTIHSNRGWSYGRCTKGVSSGKCGWFPAAAIRLSRPWPCAAASPEFQLTSQATETPSQPSKTQDVSTYSSTSSLPLSPQNRASTTVERHQNTPARRVSGASTEASPNEAVLSAAQLPPGEAALSEDKGLDSSPHPAFPLPHPCNNIDNIDHEGKRYSALLGDDSSSLRSLSNLTISPSLRLAQMESSRAAGGS